MATVYKILSPDLLECYVGSTVQRVEKRWRGHKEQRGDTNSGILFEKYGIDNCKFVVMEVCPVEERSEKEQWWLDHSVGVVNRNAVIGNPLREKELRNARMIKRRDEILAYRKIWREAHKEKIKEYATIYRETHREEFNTRQNTMRALKKKE